MFFHINFTLNNFTAFRTHVQAHCFDVFVRVTNASMILHG